MGYVHARTGIRAGVPRRRPKANPFYPAGVPKLLRQAGPARPGRVCHPWPLSDDKPVCGSPLHEGREESSCSPDAETTHPRGQKNFTQRAGPPGTGFLPSGPPPEKAPFDPAAEGSPGHALEVLWKEFL